jgi:hypothetical protein
MSGRIKVEDGVKWLDSGSFSDVHEVHEYKGTTWRGSPEIARVAHGRKSSASNAKFDPTGGVLVGIKYEAANWDRDRDTLKGFYDKEVVLHMTRDEAINMARHILDAATGSHL